VSDIPYIVQGAWRANHIPWYARLARVGWYIEEHLMWPSHWFLLTLGGLVPRLVNPSFAQSQMGIWQSSLVSAIVARSQDIPSRCSRPDSASCRLNA